ncbi:MAG: thioredoxin-disulfide reductase [Anaplasmataceae bacterium]|nr:thioredoxin-disulfide reductase [Anaplasmataceae bacterium]
MSTVKQKVVIIGSGPAGCTAAIYAARAGLEPLMIAGKEPGGQLTTTTEVENYPGFPFVTGPDLMEKMIEQSKIHGTKIKYNHVASVDLSKPKELQFFLDNGEQIIANSLVIATGASAKWLGIASEQEMRGFGVSACATCDGMFFRNKDVAVIGGGNTAVEEALFLTQHAKKVYLVHRRESLRAEKILQDRLFSNEKVEIIWNHQLKDVLKKEENGGKLVSGIEITSTIDYQSKIIDLQGVFIAIGHQPNSDIFKKFLPTDSHGYIQSKKDGTTATDIPGVFLSGDIYDDRYRQAVTAAGTGCMAALDAYHWLLTNELI